MLYNRGSDNDPWETPSVMLVHQNKANNYTHLADRTVRKFTVVLYVKGHCGP